MHSDGLEHSDRPTFPAKVANRETHLSADEELETHLADQTPRSRPNHWCKYDERSSSNSFHNFFISDLAAIEQKIAQESYPHFKAFMDEMIFTITTYREHFSTTADSLYSNSHGISNTTEVQSCKSRIPFHSRRD